MIYILGKNWWLVEVLDFVIGWNVFWIFVYFPIMCLKWYALSCNFLQFLLFFFQWVNGNKAETEIIVYKLTLIYFFLYVVFIIDPLTPETDDGESENSQSQARCRILNIFLRFFCYDLVSDFTPKCIALRLCFKISLKFDTCYKCSHLWICWA